MEGNEKKSSTYAMHRFSHICLTLFSTKHALTAFASLSSWTFFDQNRLRTILASSGRNDVLDPDYPILPEKKELSKNTSFDDSLDTFDPMETDLEQSFENSS